MARTLEYWHKLGLAESALRQGQVFSELGLLVDGRQASRFVLGGPREDRTPYPLGLVLEQSRTERLLDDALRDAGHQVEWQTSLLGVAQDADRATVTLEHPDGSEDTVTAGWVVAADGAKSPVRRPLGLGFDGLTYDRGFFLADVDMHTPLGHEDMIINLTADGFMGLFPMPGHRRFRILGSLPREQQARSDAGEQFELERVP